jgi:hypothetical protein
MPTFALDTAFTEEDLQRLGGAEALGEGVAIDHLVPVLI